MIHASKQEGIALEVIKTLYSRFETFPEDTSNNRNAPFHEEFLRAFTDRLEDNVTDISVLITLSSWLHGLNTTLGQSFFENVAHLLSDGYKKEFTAKRNTLLNVAREQKRAIADIITDLKNSATSPDLSSENERIFNVTTACDLEANSFTADVFIESDDEIVAIELKSVRPNAGEMRGEKQKILEAKAALYNEFSDKDISYYIGFPFDPTSTTPTGSDKTRFLRYLIDGEKYFDQAEVLLAEELWDFLSGTTGTMRQILSIIRQIATPQFRDKHNYLNQYQNIINDRTNYLQQLEEWFLFQEKNLIVNYDELETIINSDNSAKRKFRQPLFKQGKYNISRTNHLKNLLS